MIAVCTEFFWYKFILIVNAPESMLRTFDLLQVLN